MEITWDRIQALGERLVKSRELEIDIAMGGTMYVVFTREEKYSAIVDDQKGRTHRVTAKGPWDLECDCPDYQYNDHLHGGFCKHVMAVMAYRGQHPVIVRTIPDHREVSDKELRTIWPTPLIGDGLTPVVDDLERKIQDLY